MKSPKKYRKGKIVYKRTKHSSYVNPNDPFMVQEKNAMSERELIKYGYKPEKNTDGKM